MPNTRLPGLDVLRGVAILMVLIRHSPLPDTWWLKQVGWLGVDLFFVLSGYLVSRLLYKEWDQTGTIRPIRFLIRRGFKIYPSYYLFVGATALYPFLMYGHGYSWKLLVLESAFVQNYVPAIWIHTWSLAVEEHFYFALAGLTFLFIRRKWLSQPRIVLAFLAGLWVSIMVLRWWYCQHQPNTFYFFQTHLRADGLILGVGLAYGAHYLSWQDTLLSKGKVLGVAALLLS
ncbi:MAG: acyltransferase, partial [Bacteroidota bacterium]